MAFLQVELRVVEVLAPAVARAAGVTEDRILAGVLRLWVYCWTQKTSMVTRGIIAGAFGGELLDAIVAALMEDFLEEDGAFYRVRGADKYLRLRQARAEGAAKTNAERKRRSTVAPAAHERHSSDASGSLADALTLNTEHGTLNTTKTTVGDVAGSAFDIPPPDPEKMESWTAHEFWAACEQIRRDLGYPPEKWPAPVALSRLWSEALGVASVRDLGLGFTRYAQDPFWRSKSPPAPFKGFLSQWSKYLPVKVPNERV